MVLKLLDNINKPSDLQKLQQSKLPRLCDEIREFLIASVIDTGGHLASNLGTVELTVALNRVFSEQNNRIIYDVGHQCYAQKLITGRKDGFEKLRQSGGVTGFPCPLESEYDCFVTGHGNTSISAAVGMATAKKIRGEDGMVIAVIGDGSFGGGMVYEGMNNIDTLDNLIVILNDNEMSISKNVGGLSRYLNRLRLSDRYLDMKHGTFDTLKKVPLVGSAAIKGLRGVKSVARQLIYNDTFFEMFGFQYYGVVDGHDVGLLCEMLENVKQMDRPVFLHVKTQKGKGYHEAEKNPKAFHSVSPADKSSAKALDFSAVFGNALCKAAHKNSDIVAITAAMKDGTGLSEFARRYRSRFFDVGMAEQHAVTFGAGLALQGCKPVVAIYSTFLQRSYDQIMNDVLLNNADVLFAVDRCGLVPADGETHQGIFDVSYFSHIEDSVIVSPSNFEETEHWLARLVDEKGVRVLRYPRGSEPETLASLGCSGNDFDVYACENVSQKAKVAIVTYGIITEEALKAQDILSKRDIACDVIKLTKIHPIPLDIIEDMKEYSAILCLHDDITAGGIGEQLTSILYKNLYTGKILDVGVKAGTIKTATVPELRKKHGLNGEAVATLLLVGDVNEA